MVFAYDTQRRPSTRSVSTGRDVRRHLLAQVGNPLTAAEAALSRIRIQVRIRDRGLIGDRGRTRNDDAPVARAIDIHRGSSVASSAPHGSQGETGIP